MLFVKTLGPGDKLLCHLVKTGWPSDEVLGHRAGVLREHTKDHRLSAEDLGHPVATLREQRGALGEPTEVLGRGGQYLCAPATGLREHEEVAAKRTSCLDREHDIRHRRTRGRGKAKRDLYRTAEVLSQGAKVLSEGNKGIYQVVRVLFQETNGQLASKGCLAGSIADNSPGRLGDGGRRYTLDAVRRRWILGAVRHGRAYGIGGTSAASTQVPTPLHAPVPPSPAIVQLAPRAARRALVDPSSAKPAHGAPQVPVEEQTSQQVPQVLPPHACPLAMHTGAEAVPPPLQEAGAGIPVLHWARCVCAV